jgi:hypothetical protein
VRKSRTLVETAFNVIKKAMGSADDVVIKGFASFLQGRKPRGGKETASFIPYTTSIFFLDYCDSLQFSLKKSKKRGNLY